jgi:uncharacterized protein (DUF2147 family)
MKTENAKYHDAFDEVTSRPKACELKVKNKKSVAAVILILFSSTILVGQSVEGRWTTYNERTGSPLSVIEIIKSGNSIEGKVSQILLEPYQGEDPICTKCSGDRKDRKVVGMNFLWGFKQENGSWESGKILDPESGEVYASKLWMDDSNTLQVRGYAGPLDLFYRTQT